MTTPIHPTALIAETARLGAGVTVGPYSIIHDGVRLADGVSVGAHCEIGGGGMVTIGAGAVVASKVVINGVARIGERVKIGVGTLVTGDVRIGDDTTIFNHSSIGTQAQQPAFPDPIGYVEIGRRCIIREYVSVHRPTTDGLTSIGDDCYIMANCHIAHDCRIGNGVKMANVATMGGHTHIGDHAYLGLHCVIHQRLQIGAYTMIGMNSIVIRHTPPFATVVGQHFTKLNRIGLSIRGVDEIEIDRIEAYFRDPTSVAPSVWTQMIDAFEVACEGKNIMRPIFLHQGAPQ